MDKYKIVVGEIDALWKSILQPKKNHWQIALLMRPTNILNSKKAVASGNPNKVYIEWGEAYF